jgi:hypothetical protein
MGELNALIEDEHLWLLPLSGHRVERLCIDFAVTLIFDKSLELRIEQPFVIEEADGRETLVVPEGDPQRLAVVVALARRVVAEAMASRTVA